MKPISFTSDWHIGHEAILNFSNRPFQNIDEMERALIVRYNNTVPKNGICYFLGDMGWGDKKRLSNVIKQLHGTKVLILGNHDKGINAMYDVGFDVVLYSGKFLIGNHTVTMSHCPLLGVKREDTSKMRGAREGEAWHGENRHGYKFSLKDEGQFYLHGHIHCLSEDTEILTRAGWKTYREILPTDECLSYNISSKMASWNQIRRVISTDYKGSMTHIKTRHIDQVITGNHRLLVKSNQGADSFSLKTVGELGYVINRIPVAADVGNSEIPLTDEDIRLIIWIVADGHLELETSGIRFHLKKPRKIKRLTSLLANMNIPFSKHRQKDGTTKIRLYVGESKVSRALGVIGEIKRLPRIFETLSKRQAIVAIHEYANTDGCYCNSENVIQISSSKEEEIDILQIMCSTSGIYAKKQLCKRSGSYLLYVNLRRDTATFNRRVNIVEVPYKGKVWCVETEMQNFMIRRNGTVSFTGNSPNGGRSKKILDRQYDVGVDANNYTPVSLRTIESWIAKTLQKR